MRIARPALCLALAASLTAAGVAGAATRPKPKPVCNLVTDASGDANGFLVTDTGLPIPSNDYLDITSADLATDAKNLTAVLRMKAVGADSTSPTGGMAYFNFSVAGVAYFVNATLDGQGGASEFAYGDFSGAQGTRNTLGTATGFVDAAKKEIHITAPVSGFPTKIKTGTKITDLSALGQRFLGTSETGGLTPTADEAVGAKTYVAGALSCVKPGK